MIAWLSGTLKSAGISEIVLDVGGVGYRVNIPVSLTASLPPAGGPVELFVCTQVREDAITLYGFPTREDQVMFELLIGVSGVGPKVALSVMSALSTEQIESAIAGDDAATLQRVPGVGAKTAQRMVLDLKDKVAESAWGRRATAAASVGRSSDAVKDAVEALIGLGYPQAQARKAADQVVRDGARADDVAALVRAALQVLTR
jgi:Holliday junction DNA helicase RuvA